mgnify:CR=1 FL=1
MSIRKGDRIVVHYTGKYENGTVFDSSFSRKEPVTFTVGNGQMIEGFEEAVLGMTTGEEKTVTLPPEKAYGAVLEDNFVELPLVQLPESLNPEVGEVLTLSAEGQPVQVRVREVRNETLLLDGNHPMAGKTLVFTIRIVEINPEQPPKGVNILPDW